MGKIPEGFNTLTPQICVKDGAKAIAHYVEALGARELHRLNMPGSSKIVHACLQIGSSKLFLMDELFGQTAPKGGKGGASFYVYVEDVDRAHRRAVAAGMKELMPPTDMFWGDRQNHLMDPFGHTWNLATQMREVAPADMERGMMEQFGSMGGAAKPKARPKAKAATAVKARTAGKPGR